MFATMGEEKTIVKTLYIRGNSMGLPDNVSQDQIKQLRRAFFCYVEDPDLHQLLYDMRDEGRLDDYLLAEAECILNGNLDCRRAWEEWAKVWRDERLRAMLSALWLEWTFFVPYVDEEDVKRIFGVDAGEDS
ncbi:MAG: hypothetical protein QXE52_08060 [Candidatus Caldarchaeum sp.]